MPELPEVETIRRSLSRTITGKKIKSLDVRTKKLFIGSSDDMIGSTIISLKRWAKIFTIVLSNGRFVQIHLKMSGELLYAKDSKNAELKNILPRAGSKKLPNKHTRIIVFFTDNSALYFNDLRMFGWMKVTTKEEKPKSPDALSREFTVDHLQHVFCSTKRSIKTVLMDQEKMGGIGNIYANDALWQAKIHPARAAISLTITEIKKLHRAIIEILKEAIKYKGSSAKDEMYVLPNGEKGQYQNHLKVYHRTGSPCLRCKTKIEAMRLGGRGTFFCPKCQK